MKHERLFKINSEWSKNKMLYTLVLSWQTDHVLFQVYSVGPLSEPSDQCWQFQRKLYQRHKIVLYLKLEPSWKCTTSKVHLGYMFSLLEMNRNLQLSYLLYLIIIINYVSFVINKNIEKWKHYCMFYRATMSLVTNNNEKSLLISSNDCFLKEFLHFILRNFNGFNRLTSFSRLW